jgi:hypothetical protein
MGTTKRNTMPSNPIGVELGLSRKTISYASIVSFDTTWEDWFGAVSTPECPSFGSGHGSEFGEGSVSNAGVPLWMRMG